MPITAALYADRSACGATPDIAPILTRTTDTRSRFASNSAI
ncbi:MAG TPA: hypothetical protein VHD56_02265 [Tepidisphaeraceae bacterium]|nr:hypothetical protein [Tepidisphaeraceae bacterium]